ncbi:MAG: type II toxin-antitoxin system VapC family toxin [Treponema sp.]|nr:type II toxin-antitoxin system VapC family toxin [Treponema sp.]MCL2250709.1 type II toxin-antitoxin system VapC family toxin [Treponema sp.]
MGKKYLLDSNVIIGYLAGKLPQDGMKIVSEMVDQIPNISVISQIEILRFNDTSENEAILEKFINSSLIYPLSNNIVKCTIELCKQNKIKLPDAIIAATSITEGFTLVTRNINDFKKIPNLELLNPFD